MSKNSLVPPERGDVSLLTGGLLLNKKAKLAGEGVISKLRLKNFGLLL